MAFLNPVTYALDNYKNYEGCLLYSLPEQIVDNGPQFISEKYSTFNKANRVKHIKLAPCHPSTSGTAETSLQGVDV